MPEIPECLSRRYKALDDLIQELSSYQLDRLNTESASDEPGIKLMCDFWDILKEDPNVNLTEAVQQRLRANAVNSGVFGSRHVSCFRSGCCNNDDLKQENPKKIKISGNPGEKSQCCSSKSAASSVTSHSNMPLNKVLCNLKEAASFEKKCHGKINQLQETQKDLQEQIQVLEQKEKEGMKLLKQADCMWSCMEEAYKKKIAESLERQNVLLKELKEVESSNTKWRKNKKDLEFQMNNINKCYQEILEKINEKSSDINCINMEIETFKKRIDSNKTDIEAAKKSFGYKKQASESKMKSIASEVTKLEKSIDQEKKNKLAKEQEGTKYIKEAREQLQKLCKVLLQKKLQNEDLQAEREALFLEIELLVQNCNQCREKCKNKQESMEEEIKSIDKEIAEFKVRCIQCHECIDTSDIRKFCTDCPKCLEERNCLNEGDHCNIDHTMDCVCMTVKQKFLDNVFDNMYTALERQVQTCPGKAVAEEVLKCLKNSRNGKLNEATRKILQDFILTTVKKNLNLTIVGGAVKTRCEMDADTYKQLMVCLKQVKVTKPQKTDKGTAAKKEPCKRWGGTSECNCPKGPKACICTKKAPPPINEPLPCPPQADKEDLGEQVVCPHKDNTTCGPDCGMQGVTNAVGSEVAAWRPNPCQGPTCQFKNMRAAQCVLGPEILISSSDPITQSSFSPATSILDDQVACRCSGVARISCNCHKDSKQMKVKLSHSCDKDTCVVQKSVAFKNKVNQDETNILINTGEKNKLSTSEPKMTSNNIKSVLDNVSPIVTKTRSGDLKVALDAEIVRLIDKKLQDNPNLSVALNKSNSGEISVDLLTEDIISRKNNSILAKKTPSGNIVLEFNKKTKKKCTSHIVKPNNIRNKSPVHQSCGNEKDLTHKSLTKVIFDTNNKKNSGCNTKRNYNNNLFKVRIKSSNNTNSEVVFAMKQSDAGVYDLILDREFEKWHLQTIDDNNVKGKDDYARFLRTSSGNFIMQFDVKDNNDLESKNALLVRSHSGNIKVVVSENELETQFIERKFGSVLSSQTVSRFLDKLPNSCGEVRRKSFNKSRMITNKSSSDSNVYGRVKFDIKNNQNLIESEAVLKKTTSGQYTVVLDKESKSAFINNLEKTINRSSKGLIPIKRTNSGNITVNLNSRNTSQYGSLKITKSGNMYVLINKNNIQEISTNTTENEDAPSNISQNLNTETISSKATTTNCKGQCEEGSCDKTKCICDSKECDSKEWVMGHAEIFSENKGFAVDTSNNENSNNNIISKDKSTKNLPHIVIKPCGCKPIEMPVAEKYDLVQSTCPYHIDRYQELSNEILEISSLCQRDLDEINITEESLEQNKPIEPSNRVDWDSLQFLPPQLPAFLKDYSTY